MVVYAEWGGGGEEKGVGGGVLECGRGCVWAYDTTRTLYECHGYRYIYIRTHTCTQHYQHTPSNTPCYQVLVGREMSTHPTTAMYLLLVMLCVVLFVMLSMLVLCVVLFVQQLVHVCPFVLVHPPVL